jgi:hypothetical protein
MLAESGLEFSNGGPQILVAAGDNLGAQLTDAIIETVLGHVPKYVRLRNRFHTMIAVIPFI